MRKRAPGSVQERYVSLQGIDGPVLTLEQRGSLVRRSVLEVVGTYLDDEEREGEMYEMYHRLFSLSFPLQIIVRVRPLDIAAYLQYVSPALSPQKAIWERLARDHVAFLQEQTRQRGLLSRRFYVVVPAEDVEGEESRFRVRQSSEGMSLSQAGVQLRGRCEAVSFHLQGIGAQTRLLTGRRLLDFYQSFFLGSGHISREIYERVQTRRPVVREGEKRTLDWRDIVAPQEIVEFADYLSVDRAHYVSTLCLDHLPRQVSFGWLRRLVECDEVFDLIHQIVPRSTEATLPYLRRQRTYAEASSLSRSHEGRIVDAGVALASSDLLQIVEQIVAGEQTVHESSLHLLVRGSSRRELEQRVGRIAHRVNAVLGSRPRLCSFEQATAFCKSLPGVMVGRRPVLLPSSILATMVPYFNHFIFQPSPTAILEGMTEYHEPVILDWWDLVNANRLIIGPPGFGKSYKAKLDILHLYYMYKGLACRSGQSMDNFQVLLVDPEREVNREEGEGISLVDALGGQSIRFSAGSSHHLNPFDLPPFTQEDPNEDILANHIEKLHRLFDLMLAFNVNDKAATLSPQEKSLLDEAISLCYQDAGIFADRATHSRPAPILGDLYTILSSGRCGTDPTNLAQRLRRYVSGSLSGLFSQRTNVRLDSTVVQFDVRDLGEHMRAVALMMISHLIWDIAFSSRIPRYLFIDELATVGRYKAGQEFLEEMFQRSRKHFLSVVGMTQHPGHLSESLLANCATHVLLHQDHTSIDYVERLFKLSRRESQRLRGFGPGEALMLIDGKRMMVRFHASPEENALITTNRRELAALEEARQKIETRKRVFP